MTLEKYFEANKDHEGFVKIIRNVKSVILGDMETENKNLKLFYFLYMTD